MQSEEDRVAESVTKIFSESGKRITPDMITGKAYQAARSERVEKIEQHQDLSVACLKNAEVKKVEWLIPRYVPRGQICLLAAEGGAGKGFIWASVVSALSAGSPTLFEEKENAVATATPQKVLFFSSEDSVEHVIKQRIIDHKGNTDNILYMSVTDDRFRDVKTDSKFLESMVLEHKPSLVILDPIQSFLPDGVRLESRNSMRSCLNPLVSLGEKSGATFLLVMHTNKRAGASGRNRIADSADMWDIARSVIVAGKTKEKSIRYISHEKCNYEDLQKTVLFSIENGRLEVKGFTEKKDFDFMNEEGGNSFAPVKDEIKEMIIEFLKDGEKEASELIEVSRAYGYSKVSFDRARAEMKKDGVIKYKSIGSGRDNSKKWYVSLLQTE